MNVLLFGELNELWLEETWVTFDLVGSGCNASAVNESLEMLLGVVGDAYCAGLLLGQLRHRLPCVDNRNIVEHLDIVTLEREQVLVDVTALIESYGEMHKVEIQVFETELRQAIVKRGWYILGAMLRVPELGGDEDILTLEAGNATIEGLLESLGNFLLVAIHLREIDVSVTGLESFKNGDLDLTGLGLPCTKSQLTVQI